jgi:hypothetical protein
MFAGHDCKIPAPGYYFTIQIGDYPIIVLRGRDGAIRALHNMCRHRGSRIKLADTRIAFESTIVKNGNWKLVWENNRECYHCAASHPELLRTFPGRATVSGIEGVLGDPEVTGHWDRCEAAGLPSVFLLSESGQYRTSRVPLVDKAVQLYGVGPGGGQSTAERRGHRANIGSLMIFHYPSTRNHVWAITRSRSRCCRSARCKPRSGRNGWFTRTPQKASIIRATAFTRGPPALAIEPAALSPLDSNGAGSLRRAKSGDDPRRTGSAPMGSKPEGLLHIWSQSGPDGKLMMSLIAEKEKPDHILRIAKVATM